MSDEEVQVLFGADTSGAEAGAARVKDSIHGVSDEVTQAEELFKYLGERMVEVFALHEIADFIEKMAELGTQIERTAQMTGLSTDAVQQLGYAAQLTGGTSEGAATTIERLERAMVQASTGTGAASKAFETLGIQIKNADGTMRPIQQVLGDIADKFQGTQDGATKTYYAMTLMGRGGAQLIPILNEGRDGLAKLNEEFDNTGGKLAPETIDKLEGVHKALANMKAAATGAEASMTADFSPAIILATEYVANLAHGIEALVHILTAIPDAAIAAGTAIGNAFKPGGKDQWGGSWSLDRPQTVNQATFLNPDGTPQKPELPAPPAEGTQDNTAQQLAKEQVSFEEEMGRLRIANEKSVLDTKVALGQLTKAQEYTQEQDLVDQEYALERTALENELQIADLTVVEKQKINDQLLLLDQKYANQSAELMRKSAVDQANIFKQSFNNLSTSIEQPFDQMLAGVLQGTQTLQQAMSKMFADLATSVVESIAKIVIEWLVFEALTYGEGTWSSFVALEGGGKGGVGSQLLASFDVGSNYVPQTGLAMVHQGEMIIPASEQGPAYSGGNNGSTNITFQIQAIDTQTGAQFIKNNAANIAQVVNTALRNGNTTLTKTMKA